MRQVIKKSVSIIIVTIVCLAFSLAILFDAGFLQRLDNATYDAFQRINANGASSDVPVIIDIDEKSLAKFGQWPWPRYLLASLVGQLNEYGISAVGLDIIQSESDRSSPELISADLLKYFGVELNINNLPRALQNNDVNFADAIAHSPVVLGAFVEFGDYNASTSNIPSILPKPTGLAQKTPPGAPKPEDTITKTSSIILPLKDFFDVAPIGIVNAKFSSDGIMRSVPLLVNTNGKIYASLALRTLMIALKHKTLRLDSNIDGLASISLGKLKVPINHDGSFYPVFNGKRGTYKYYSASDVIEGLVEPSKLAGRIAFVGSSATGLLDIRSTPLDPVLPGVEVHANLVDNILNSKSILVPTWSDGAQILAMIIVCLMALMFFAFAPAAFYLLIGLVLGLGVFYVSWLSFKGGIFISPAPTALALLICAASILLIRFYKEQKGRRQIKSAFGRYVAPEVVSKIDDSGDLLAGEHKKVSILFTDVRGFTSISEKLSPVNMVHLLNMYFTPMTACVKEYSGTMDKFVGDALMAFWNAPLDVPQHEKKALQAAIKMQEELDKLRPKIKESFGVDLNIGAGVHTGYVHVGNMGSNDLMDYTCIGDNVNLASRLEGLSKYYGVGIVLSGSVAKACTDMSFRKLDEIRVKGKSQSIEIFTPLSTGEIKSAANDWWHEARMKYVKGEFKEAMQAFKALSIKHASYKAGCEIFMKRCEALIKEMPQNWDGVWSFDTK